MEVVTVKVKLNGKIKTIEMPIKTAFYKPQTLGIQFVLTRSVLITDTDVLYIDTKGWRIRDFNTGVVICGGATQKEARNNLFKMIKHPQFSQFYKNVTGVDINNNRKVVGNDLQ